MHIHVYNQWVSKKSPKCNTRELYIALCVGKQRKAGLLLSTVKRLHGMTMQDVHAYGELQWELRTENAEPQLLLTMHVNSVIVTR